MQRTILGSKVGQKVDLTVWRDGQDAARRRRRRSCRAKSKLARRRASGGSNNAPEGEARASACVDHAEIAERLGVDPKIKGAVVTSVRDGSPAQEAGLQQGDIIIEVDRKPVSTADDAVKTLGSDRAGRPPPARSSRRGALFVIIPAA